jgi:hypothetical protein
MVRLLLKPTKRRTKNPFVLSLQVSERRVSDLTADLTRYLRPNTPVLPARFATKHLLRVTGLKKGRHESLDAVRGVAIVALSGIGCPRSLELLLLKVGTGKGFLRGSRCIPPFWLAVESSLARSSRTASLCQSAFSPPTF